MAALDKTLKCVLNVHTYTKKGREKKNLWEKEARLWEIKKLKIHNKKLKSADVYKCNNKKIRDIERERERETERAIEIECVCKIKICRRVWIGSTGRIFRFFTLQSQSLKRIDEGTTVFKASML